MNLAPLDMTLTAQTHALDTPCAEDPVSNCKLRNSDLAYKCGAVLGRFNKVQRIRLTSLVLSTH
jgi:hypothetical protein